MSNFTFRPGTSTPQPVSEYPSWAAKEMIAFADWCLRQLQGDSGMGDGHWDQFPEYRRGRDYLSLLTRTTNPGLDQQDVPDRTPQPVSECPHNTPNLEDGYLKCNDCGVNLTNLLPPVKPVSDAAGAKELVAYTCGCVGVRSQPNCAIHSFCGQGGFLGGVEVLLADRFGHGEWVIGLEGVPGGYLLSRVIRRDRPELFADSPTMAEIKRLRAALEIIAACRHVSGSAQGAFRSNLRIADAALAGADLSDVDVVEAVCGGTWKRN